MERKLGAAIFGAGWVAGEHLKAYVANPHCIPVAVGSRSAESARRCAELAGCPKATIYTSYEDLIADTRVDVISICTPHHLPAEETIRAAQAGKHVLIEKPMCISIDEMRAMRDAIHASGVKSLVSFCLRWNPLFLNIRELLDRRAIGEIYYAEVDYWNGITPAYGGYDWIITKEHGMSSLLSAGCHAVDALRFFIGSEVTEVSAYSTHHRGGGPWGYDPTIVFLCRFESGAIGKVSSCLDTLAPYSFNISLIGSEGAIRDNRVFSTTMFPKQTDYAVVPTILPDSRDVTHHPFIAEIAALVDSIRLGKPPGPDFDDAFKTHEICFAADLSAETGQPVKLPLVAD